MPTHELDANATISLSERMRREFSKQPDVCDALDRAEKALHSAMKRVQPVSIGLVGESQVGKSSLMNALLGKMALPAGGVGPLTAQAIHVSWGEEEAMKVAYHGRQRLNRLRFAIEQPLRRAGMLSEVTAEDAEAEDADEVEDTEVNDATPDDNGPSGRVSDRVEFYRAQARRLLCETVQTAAEPVDLVNSLRAVLGMPPCAGRSAPAEWDARIRAITERLGTTEEITRSSAGGAHAFDKELHLRAADWLAPLVERLELALPDPLLRNITVVDLPGIGVIGDDAARVAGDFVRRDASGIVMVVRNNGLGENLASLLEDTGVITRFIFSSEDDPLPLSVVVTHLDDVARTRFTERRAAARNAGEPPPDRYEVFRELAEPMGNLVRHQLGVALRDSQSYREAEGGGRTQRERAITRLLADISIHCVAAPDYLSLSTGNDDLAFLQDKAATGIPGLREALTAVGRTERERRDRAVKESAEALHLELRSILEIERSQLHDAEDDAIARQNIQDQVRSIAVPLRERMKAYHGEVVAIFRHGLPQRIKLICAEAIKAAERHLVLLRQQGQKLHFRTLQAALKRDGVFARRSVDYPGTLTNAFVDRVAADWEPNVVTFLDVEVCRLAERDATLVGELIDGVRSIPKLDPAPVDALRRHILARAKGAVPWRKERFEELRRDVHDDLYKLVVTEMGNTCEIARRAGKDRGTGAKPRVLDVLATGGQKAIERVALRAAELLNRHLDNLVMEIRSGYLAENSDPLASAVNALLGPAAPPDPASVRARRERREGIERFLQEMGPI